MSRHSDYHLLNHFLKCGVIAILAALMMFVGTALAFVESLLSSGVRLDPNRKSAPREISEALLVLVLFVSRNRP